MAILTRRRGAHQRIETGRDQVLVGSIWMVLATGAVSLGSFVFWLIAARMADADVVGRSAGLFSAVFFVSYATSLGLPIAVGRYAASSDPLDTLRFRVALVATAAASAIGVTIFFLVDPRDLLEPVTSRGPLLGWFILCVLSVGVAISVLVDVRLMGHRRWRDVFVRSTVIALIRLPPLLFAVRDDSGFWVFVTAAGGYAVTALPYLPRLVVGAATGPVRWRDHMDAIRFAGVNYVSQLAIQAPLFVTPVVVALVVSDQENATFYLSWGMMSVVYVAIHLLGRTLLVEGSKHRAEIVPQARTTLLLGLGLAVPAAALSVPLSPIFERIYGAEHADISAMLPLLLLGTVPWAVTRTSLAVARTRGATRQTLAVSCWSALTVLTGVTIGGVVGDAATASLGWALGSFCALFVTGPVMWAQLRPADR